MTENPNLHPIDKPFGKYTQEELEKFMVFCILDRAQPYKKVCDAFDALEKNGLIYRISLRNAEAEGIAKVLKATGYRFPNQTARFLHDFGSNPIDLQTSTRDELVKNILGIGMKLGSMFVRNTRHAKVAVIDIHIKRYLQEHGVTATDYRGQEKAFLEIAEKLGRDPGELDLEIWEERRVKHLD